MTRGGDIQATRRPRRRSASTHGQPFVPTSSADVATTTDGPKLWIETQRE